LSLTDSVSLSIPDHWFYAGVDLLILLAIVRDLAAMRRVHVVLLVSLPILVAVQVTEMYSFVNAAPWWMDIAHKLLA
jgi:cell division protein FtsW (lipid II flippase)